MSAAPFEHQRFGTLAFEEEEVITFPGLPGFPGARRFIVRSHDAGTVFAWLISVDEPALALVIANPWHAFPDYAPEIPNPAVASLEGAEPDSIEIVSVVTVTRSGYALNLAAPILIHTGKRRGIQVILDRGGQPVHAEVPVPATAAPEATPPTSSLPR